MSLDLRRSRIAVIGLGYVGLPLAAAFARTHEVIGFDIDDSRIAELAAGYDRTRELSSEELMSAQKGLSFSSDAASLKSASVYIVTTPTPIDEHKRPDLGPVLSATRTIAEVLSKGDVVIYESTVYPGATEEECVPILELLSGLHFNEDFFVGYSPERINPGDREHRFENIVKVTSGSTPQCASAVDELYSAVVTAGTHLAPSIKVAEAAKVIENTQRDINIALINELAIVFAKLGIDTSDVLRAAGTKWNFLPFKPGLVGGHCIGVDPYYLTHKAQAVGYHPELILAGRRLNDRMGAYVAAQLIKRMIAKNIHPAGSRVLVMGLTFKENCPDLRNTRVIDIINELEEYGVSVDVYDPWVDPNEARGTLGLVPIPQPADGAYSAVILAVSHSKFVDMGSETIRQFGIESGSVFCDLKSAFSADQSDMRL